MEEEAGGKEAGGKEEGELPGVADPLCAAPPPRVIETKEAIWTQTIVSDTHDSVLESWDRWSKAAQNGPFTDFGSDKYQEHAN